MTVFARRFARLVACLVCCGCSLLVLPRLACAQLGSLSTIVRSSGSSGLAFSKAVQVNFPLDEDQAFYVGGEFVRETSFPDAFTEELKGKQSWKMKAVPITVGYRRYLADPDRPIVPVLSVGLSHYFCLTKQVDVPTAGPMVSTAATAAPLDYDFDERMGMGYGGEIALGLRADVNRHFFAIIQGRSRYIHGLGYMADDDINSQLVTFDFSLGLGVKL